MSRKSRQDPIYSSTTFIFLFNPPKHAWLPVKWMTVYALHHIIPIR